MTLCGGGVAGPCPGAHISPPYFTKRPLRFWRLTWRCGASATGCQGACQLRTCWRATPDFRAVASTIKRQYRKALVVAQEELNNGPSVLRGRPRGRRRSRARPAPKSSLLFFEKSPSFCEADPKMDSAGTSGRVCRIGRTTRTGSCDLLCCGRGHALIRKSSMKACNCTFHWCCRVDCQRCQDDKWISICK
ncbi:jg13187 [Pararge aegeria aegeria]|uniref:Protein Wnt n=1 Tax=Pararge aegeria aegeria TaxID=348720 RepID=A0A8S4RAR2_9NEOP|nr:jg13187 [Pararge aegeria aegeria]